MKKSLNALNIFMQSLELVSGTLVDTSDFCMVCSNTEGLTIINNDGQVFANVISKGLVVEDNINYNLANLIELFENSNQIETPEVELITGVINVMKVLGFRLAWYNRDVGVDIYLYKNDEYIKIDLHVNVATAPTFTNPKYGKK